jgi:chemotaxis protein MotB
MADKQKCPECEAGAPAWVVTFGDLMSLLMTFFVLLLSFATMEKPREIEEAVISIKGAFGVMPMNLAVVQVNPMPIRMKRMPQKVEDTAREIQREAQVSGQSEAVKVVYDATGAIKISLPNHILYDSGNAQLLPGSLTFLQDVGNILSELPEDSFFEIHGHTDVTPLGSTQVFRDNKDLSYARADAVMRYLAQSSSMSLDRFRAVANGSSQPIAPNTSAEGRRTNRRVEIYIKGLLTDAEIDELKDRMNAASVDTQE